MFQLHIRMNQCLTFQKHLEDFSFPYLGGNKEDLLHVTHCIISLQSFGKFLFILHDKPLINENVLSN
jgi:hypothetical protein